MKSFVTHLAAGLLGGLIGVIALAFAWHLIPAGKGESAAELGKIKERIAKLEATPAPAPDTEALAKLDGRIKALEGQTPPDIAGLTDRVAQLEQEMKALASAAKDGGSVTDAAAINQQITEAEQRIQENLDKALADAQAANAATLQTMQASIDEMKAKIAALAEAGTGGSPDLTALTERVAKLETAIDKGVAGSKSAAAAIAFANLSSAVAEGRPVRRRARHDQIVRPRPRRPRTAAGLRRQRHPDGARAYALLRREPGCCARRRVSRAVRLAPRPAARQRLDPGQGQARR